MHTVLSVGKASAADTAEPLGVTRSWDLGQARGKGKAGAEAGAGEVHSI